MRILPMKLLAATALAAMTGIAGAQSVSPSLNDWRKLCMNPPDPGCATTALFSTGSDLLAQIHVLDPDKKGPKVLRITTRETLGPSKTVAEAGHSFALAVDGKPLAAAKVAQCNKRKSFCFNNSCTPEDQICVAEAPLTPANVSALASGKELSFQLFDKTPLKFPLERYQLEVKSNGVTMAEAQAELDAESRALRRKAEAAKKKLDEEAPKDPFEDFNKMRQP